MKLKLTEAEMTALKKYLESTSDAEAIGAKEYVLDLYDTEIPATLDLVFLKQAVAVDGAAKLEYDEEMAGWYMGAPLDTPEKVKAVLTAAGVFEA